MGKGKDRSEYHVRSVQRALRILNCFSNSKPYLGVSEIGEQLKLHKSTIHALLITLEDEGYVSKNEEKNKYFLTYRLFQLGSIVSENISMKKIAIPIMQELCSRTKQSVALNVFSNNNRLVLAVCETPQPMKITIKPGQLLTLHSSAAGKILLSELSEGELDDIISQVGLQSMTPNTITDKDTLIKELELTRNRGYALCNGESYWAGSVSCALRDHTGIIIGSICIYGPMQDFVDDNLNSYIKECVFSCQRISQLLGYSFSQDQHI